MLISMALVIKRYDEEKPRLIPHYRKGAKLSGSVLPGKREKRAQFHRGFQDKGQIRQARSDKKR